ncbi:MAG: hypothetical protein OJF49_003067 [Ktedonobacterales bacterium]|jgi:uncharacterized protein YwqG|nr:MAG: hypothetical protein OJF49_003067 [Ktedonobacterales bacterium]
MDLDAARASLSTAGLPALVAQLDTLAQPCIRLASQRADESALTVGASKLGGQPDLLPGTAWPEKQGNPMSFVAQIRLEQVHAFDAQQALPAAGMLSFFYDAQQSAYGAEPTDRNGRAVYFTQGNLAALQRTPFPAALPAAARFSPCALTIASDLTLPEQPQLELPALAWDQAAQEHYDAALSQLASATDRAAPKHQLLGYPTTLQDDMRLQCQLAANGVRIEDAASDPRTPALSSGALHWRLLLQVDSDPNAGMRWADAGMLYYWIERDALQRANFENVWVVLQSD